jgi:hypothetical protein
MGLSLNRDDPAAHGIAHARGVSHWEGQRSAVQRTYQRFDTDRLRKRPIAE